MNLDQKLTMNGGNLLRGKINDAKGIHGKLRRQIDKLGVESSDTINNVKAKILDCLQGDRQIITKRSRYTTVGSPYNSWADVVKCTNKIKEILKSQLELKSQVVQGKPRVSVRGLGSQHQRSYLILRKVKGCDGHLGCCGAQITGFRELCPHFYQCNGPSPRFCISSVTYWHTINIEHIINLSTLIYQMLGRLVDLKGQIYLEVSLQLGAQSSRACSYVRGRDCNSVAECVEIEVGK